jgi:hypothetical protein
VCPDKQLANAWQFEETPQAPAYNSVHAIAWMVEYGAHTAVVDDKVYRIVAYPSGSPLAGKYGCYCEGRYSGLTADLAGAKAWCRALADDVDPRRRPVLHDRADIPVETQTRPSPFVDPPSGGKPAR